MSSSERAQQRLQSLLRRESDASDQPTPITARFTTAHLKALAVLLVVAVVAGVSMTVRARTEVVPVTVTNSSPTGSVPVPAPHSSDSPVAPIQVHVAGEVARPGVVRLPPGSRVHDAITAAGGASATADLIGLNLAAPLTDGAQVLVARAGQTSAVNQPSAGGEGAGGGGAPGESGAKINLNTASATQFEQLPGVGPVTAGNIVAWREKHGKFSRVEELQEVDGIGPKTYARLAPHVTV